MSQCLIHQAGSATGVEYPYVGNIQSQCLIHQAGSATLSAVVSIALVESQCLIHQAGSATKTVEQAAMDLRLNALFIRQVVQLGKELY